jgi:hypothetical protein
MPGPYADGVRARLTFLALALASVAACSAAPAQPAALFAVRGKDGRGYFVYKAMLAVSAPSRSPHPARNRQP